MVRVAAGLVEVSMPKSSSFGEKTMGFGGGGGGDGDGLGGGVVGLGGEGAGVGAGLVRAMLHSAPGARVVGQSVARVKLVAVS
jgi:hypothetical protein